MTKKERWYYHGDNHPKNNDPYKYYCAFCDYPRDKYHFYFEEHGNYENEKRFITDLKQGYRPKGFFRPVETGNVYMEKANHCRKSAI